MAKLITPITLIPRNAMTGVASDYTGSDPITVVIGDNTTEDLYFRGTYYKRPSETYIGLDINKYIKDLCKLDAVKPYETTYENELTDFIKFYRVKMYDSSNTEIFDFSGYVFAGAPMLGDIIRVFDGLFIGAYRDFDALQDPVVLFTTGHTAISDAGITATMQPDTTFLYSVSNPATNLDLVYRKSIGEKNNVEMTATIYYTGGTVKMLGQDVTSQLTVGGTTTLTVRASVFDFDLSSGFFSVVFSAGSTAAVNVKSYIITERTSIWFNGTQYDLLLHNRIYTFDNLTSKSLTGVTWNKALVGAPVGISLWNPTDSDRSLKASAEYYKADLTVDKSQDLPITYPVFAAKKTYALFQNDNTYQRSAFRLGLDNQTDVRAVFIERIAPCFDRNYYQVYYINRLGGLDWLIMTGKNYRRTQNEKKAYQIDNGEFSGGVFQYSSANQTKRNYLIEGKEIFELNSDIENENDYKWLEELVSSPAVWVWDYKSQLLQAVDVIDNNFEFKNHWNNQVFNFKLNCETLNNSFR